MATRDPGPVGGGVVAIDATNPGVLRTNAPHGLADGERVRIGAGQDFVLCYVKVAGRAPDELAAYSDPALKKLAGLSKVAPGRPVVRLAAQDWALVVGINLYYHPALKRLQGAVRDAELFAEWATERAYLPNDQVTLIRSPATAPTSMEAAEPKFDTVTQAFSELVTSAGQREFRRLGRRLYVFLSGHGIVPTFSEKPDYREAALLAANVDQNLLARHIGGRGYGEWFRALGIFDEVIVFLDCCRDEKSQVPPTPPFLPANWKRQTTKEGRHFYAAGATFGSSAWEQPLGEPPVIRGAFAYALLEALDDPALSDENGCLTGSILEGHLYTKVPALNDKQSPAIDYPHDPQAPEIVFAKRPDALRPKAKITFAEKYIGLTARLYLGTNTNVAVRDHVVSAGAWEVPVKVNNLYKIQIDDPHTSMLFEATGGITDVHFA